MEYIGVDYSVDLACSECHRTTRVRYSRLLNLTLAETGICCDACGRVTNHDWSSAAKARVLFREHMSTRRRATESTQASSRRSQLIAHPRLGTRSFNR
jgi:hypothetical protein